jgi:hypothetical protein
VAGLYHHCKLIHLDINKIIVFCLDYRLALEAGLVQTIAYIKLPTVDE